MTAEPMKPEAPVTRTRSCEESSTDGSVSRQRPDRRSEFLAIVRPNSKKRPEPEPAAAEDVVQGLDEVVDLLVGGDERGEELHDVHVVRRHLGEDPVAVEEGDHHQLGEERRPDGLHGLPADPERSGAGFAEDETDHEALAPDLVKKFVALDQRGEGLRERLARPADPVEDVLVVEGLEGGQSGHHGHLVLGEGRGVDHGPVHRGEDAVGDLGRREHGPDGDVAAGQGLGDGDDVGLDPVVLVGEELPRPAHPGLDLVHHEEGLMTPAGLGHGLPVLLAGQVDPLALDGLDHEGGDVAGVELPDQRVDVAEGDLGRRQQGPETVAELPAPVEREGPGGEPVETVVGVDDPVPTGGVPGELDGRLDGLGPRVGEDHPFDTGMGPGHQRFGQEAGQEGAVHLDQVGQVGVDGVVESLLDPGVVPAQGEDSEAGEEVEIAPALGVEEVATFAADVEPVEAQMSSGPGPSAGSRTWPGDGSSRRGAR